MPEPLRKPPPPPIVALAAWVVPGGGYWLLGQRTRALVVGVTIILLFLGGLLIGGVRSLEVPGYDETGQQIIVAREWIMTADPWSEIRTKPWSMAQFLAGPVSVAAGAWSVWAARPDEQTGESPGAASHARINEIGVLYTAVAGMLNLLAIIDASHRAANPPGQ